MEVAERIKIAREFGDLSENSEYEEAKNEDLLVSFDPGQDLGMYDTKKLRDVIENSTILFAKAL